ncbi:uncharacterized protein [Spinacia oleracea]|uniref:Uncharacterized protein n=1 Tax=Spinacia oleracea TaxID=3562 RepID=A0ABM3R2S1_SPIOL|nr:uncharacterized protein LOC130464395 [Spinacia oleracea]
MAPSGRAILSVFIVLSLLIIANCDAYNEEKYEGVKKEEQSKESSIGLENGVGNMKFSRKQIIIPAKCFKSVCTPGITGPTCYCCNTIRCYVTEDECKKNCH